MIPVKLRQAAFALSMIWAAILFNHVIAQLLLGYQVTSWTVQLGIPFAASLLFAACMVLFPQSSRLYLPGWIVLAFCALMAMNVVLGSFPVHSYGDNTIFLMVFADPDESPMARWLVGIELLRAAYAATWKSGPVSALVPEGLRGQGAFIQITGILCMAAGTYLLFRRWPAKLALALPVLSPLWFLFASGYLEYYPFIVCVFLGALLWFFEGEIGDKPYEQVGIVFTVLPLIYLGFAPFAAIILLCYLLVAPAKRIQTIFTVAGIFVVTISLFWNDRLSTFFDSLYHLFSDDAKYELVPQYVGLASSEDSIFFAADYALSVPHFKELFYMLFWGNGFIPFLIALAGAVVYIRKSDLGWLNIARNPKVLLGAVILTWQGYYTVFMIPFLGPSRDIDLFFVSYLLTALLGGMIWDEILGQDPGWSRGRTAVISLTFGNMMSLVIALLIVGIPKYAAG